MVTYIYGWFVDAMKSVSTLGWDVVWGARPVVRQSFVSRQNIKTVANARSCALLLISDDINF